MPKVHY